MNRQLTMRMLLAALAALFVFGAGCKRSEPMRHPLYAKGEQLRKDGSPVEAASYFRRYLAQNPEVPQGHLALAGLYDESLSNPSAALYHYDEYLRLTPMDVPDRSVVERYRELARTKLLRELSGEPLPELPAEALAAENRRLRQLNDQLQRYIVSQNRKIVELQTRSAAPPVEATTPSGNRIYIVQSGDTPGKIAQRFYGSASLYPKIMEANNLSGSGNLRIGQRLVIPPQ